MTKYSKYLFINIVSRKTFWIALFLSIAVIATLGIMHIIQVNNDNRLAISYIGQNDKFLPFVLSSMMTALIVVFIFKSGQNDGTDLLVAAKPISRMKMIFGKFFTLSIFLVGVQLVLFITYFSYAQKDMFASEGGMFRYAIALSIGGLIMQFIIASFVALAALFISRVGVLVITLLAVSTIPIVSIIVSQISYSTPKNVYDIMDRVTLMNNDEMESSIKRAEKIYSKLGLQDKLNKKNTPVKQTQVKDAPLSSIPDSVFNEEQKIFNSQQVNIQKPYYLKRTARKSFLDGEKYKKKRWYKSFAPFDMWYHWSSFYDFFYPSENTLSQNWNDVEKVFDYDTNYSMNPIKTGSKKDLFSDIYIQTLNRTKFNEWGTLKVINGAYLQLISQGTKVKGTKTELASLFKNEKISFYKRMESVIDLMQGHEHDILYYATYVTYKKIVSYYTKNNEYKKPKYIFPEDAQKKHLEEKGRDLVGGKTMSEHSHQWLLVKGDHIKVWEPTPYVKSSTRIWIWSVLVVLLFGATVFIYYRKDFK